MIDEISQRVHAAVAMTLASAADARFADISAVAFMFSAALSGIVRVVLDREVDPAMLRTLRAELPVMCRAYLATAMTRAHSASSGH